MHNSSRQRQHSKSRVGRTSAAIGDKARPISTGIICVILIGLVWIVFAQTLGHGFVNYDDHDYVYENPKITNGLTGEGILWAFTHVHSSNWHPLTSMSHMLDCSFYGVQPSGHHFTNVLLHSIAAVLLFFALGKLTGARWPSAFVAAVFAIHPLHVESVAWIAERKDVLSGVFFMLTLWSYARYVQSRRPASGRYGLVLVFFALGLMCKPTLVTVPFVLLLLDYWPLKRFAFQATDSTSLDRARALPKKSIRDLVVEKVPFFLLSAASSVATILAQEKTISTLQEISFGDRVGNAMVSYLAYGGQMIWPVFLSVVYPYPASGMTLLQPILSFIALTLITIIFFVARRRYGFLWIGWLWFLGMLVPMIGLVQVGNQARADRYTYLSQIGLYVLLVWGAVELLSKWRHGQMVLIAIALLIVTTLTAASYYQTSFWRDSETLWNRALATTSNNAIAENNLGNALMKKEGRVDEAITHFQRALEIHPNYPEAHNYLGFALANKGEWEQAISSFRTALRGRYNYPQAHNNLAISLSQLGKTDEALAESRTALQLDPDNREAHCNLALILLQLNQREEALQHLREALRLKPGDPEVLALLRQFGGS